MLNQRGGRTLSFVDLMRAGTVPPEMAAFCFHAIQGGASFLTAANPGGAGKTTLMGALLAFLPPGEKLRTVGLHASRVPRGHSAHGRECLMGHEIGRGAYFGYLWGGEANAFFHATARKVRIATNLHADTMGEIEGVLLGPDIGASLEDLQRIGFVAFMACRHRQGKTVRRVASLYASAANGHELLWEWDEGADRFVLAGQSRPEDGLPKDRRDLLGTATEFMEKMKREGPNEWFASRQMVLRYIEAGG